MKLYKCSFYSLADIIKLAYRVRPLKWYLLHTNDVDIFVCMTAQNYGYSLYSIRGHLPKTVASQTPKHQLGQIHWDFGGVHI